VEEKAPTRNEVKSLRMGPTEHERGEPTYLPEDDSAVEELAAQEELQPEMKHFIAKVIVPILIQRYIADGKSTWTPQSEVE
jgi:hypothetical protein